MDMDIEDPCVNDIPLAEQIKILVMNTIDTVDDICEDNIVITRIVVDENGDVDVTFDCYEEDE
jgi:hypothetical protein